MWIQFSLMATQEREEESRETLKRERMGMPIDCTIVAIRSADARPMWKEAEKRLKTAEAVGSKALRSLISRKAAGVLAHNWMRMERGRGRKRLGGEALETKSPS